ncbi:MerR family transcriptional regulator [Streptomyces spongiae]|uniref:MerR family transcriptional regulator n=1 Tax=Streptomyces spongiae TaxID=565072 RepID=A0A5N8XAT2_9ACTN|nr:MerR family transcriptional regulator [Streptomyces spongiae]
MPQFAENSGVPARMLRFYEDAGLLPVERAPSGRAEGLRRDDHHDGAADGRHCAGGGRLQGPQARRQPRRCRRSRPVLRRLPVCIRGLQYSP